MADADLEEQFMACFEDIQSLLTQCELEEGTINQPLVEPIIYRLELSAQFVEQLLPFVNESKLELNEVFTNLKIFSIS